MAAITSVQNPEIKEIAKLGGAKERRKQKRFIVEGLRAIGTFLTAGWLAEGVYVTPTAHEGALDIFSEAALTMVSQPVMEKISHATTPSGILAVFAMPENPPLTELGQGIVLGQLTDPGNVGTLIRTCAALGARTVVTIDSADVWSPKAIQASAGTIALMKVFHLRWDELFEHKASLTKVGLVARNGAEPNAAMKNSLLIVGSEAHGIPTPWQERCDELVTIPMPGNVESLNAAVAGSLGMYLIWR
jgi:TrmH family RNA methyltransferase